MKTIATKYINGYKIALKTNSKIKEWQNDGIYTITDINGNEHECGVWERIKNGEKKNYIYSATSFKKMERRDNIPISKRYYYLNDLAINILYNFLNDK